MSSMTDVIFLLLIFFMVTSTLIFPAAIDVDLPESSEQTSDKPLTEVYVDSDANYYLVADRRDTAMSRQRKVNEEELLVALHQLHDQDSTRTIALYGDERVEYGHIVRILDLAARNRLKMVLATRATSANPG